VTGENGRSGHLGSRSRPVTDPRNAGDTWDSDRGFAAGSRVSPPFPGVRLSRLALSPSEAAEAIGVSRDFFDEHVRPELRVVRRGRRLLVPVRELERWLERSASRVVDEVDGRRFR